MAQQEGFAGGLQFGLSVFNAMQNASYLEAQKQAMAENQQMRRDQLQLNQQKFDAEQQMHAYNKALTIVEKPDAFPRQMVLNAYNQLNQMAGGEHNITQTDIDTYSTDLTKMLGEVKGAETSEGAQMALERYRERAMTHPLFARAFNRMEPIAKGLIEKRGFYKILEEKGITNESFRTGLIEQATPDQLKQLVESKDGMELLLYRQAMHTEQRLAQGDNVSDHELLDMLGTQRRLGMKPTAKGDGPLLQRDLAQFHQEAQAGLERTQNELKPLLDAEALLSGEDRNILKGAKNEVRTLAGDYPGKLGEISDNFTLGKVKHVNDAVDAQNKLIAKYPQLQKALSEVGPQAAQRVAQIDDQLQALKLQRRQIKLQVSDPLMANNLQRIDAQMDSLEAQAHPYRQIANWYKNPDSPEALKGVFNLRNPLIKAIDTEKREHERFMTEAEKSSAATREEQLVNRHVKTIGPAEVEYQTMQDIANDPSMTDEQKMGRLAFHANEYKKRTGYMPDLNEAAQRILPQRNQTQIMSSEERKSISEAETNVVTGEALLKDFKPGYVGPTDNFINSLRAKLPEGSPEFLKLTTEHQEYRQRVQLFLAQYRNKMFGASLSQNEQKAAEDAMANLNMGDAQFPAALKEMIRWDKIMTERIKANAGKGNKAASAQPTPTVADAPVDQSKSVDAYHEWKKKNPKGTPAQFFGE